MSDLNVIDRYLEIYGRYLDSGFGLLGGEVAFLTTTLVVIDVTLAACFWSLASGEDILARLIRKTLFVGMFAFIIGNFQSLADIVLRSFAGLGLTAAGAAGGPEDLLRPGRVAALGVEAGRPMLEATQQMSGFPEVFDNLPQILVLLAAFLVVVLAFFVIAVQIFIVLVEFKLACLAGFALVPFGLLGQTAFLAERVLGFVVACGVKVMVLAIVTGIGAGLFEPIASAFVVDEGGLEGTLALALAAVALLGLSIFGPGIATGLVSGAPQLGAGAAVGAVAATAGLGIAGAGIARFAAGGFAGRTASVLSASRSVGQASEKPAPAAAQGSSEAAPAWAQRLERRQSAAHGAALTAHAVQSGDRGGGSAQIDLKEDRS